MNLLKQVFHLTLIAKLCSKLLRADRGVKSHVRSAVNLHLHNWKASIHVYKMYSKCFLTLLQSTNIGRLENWQVTDYTCQLFLRYRREIFILGVLGFLKMTRSFPNIPEEVRSLPKTSEVFRRRSYRENAYPQGPTLVDNISAIVLKSESFRLTWSIFNAVVRCWCSQKRP